MKITEIKINQKVTGYYKGDNKRIGKVIKKLKTVVYVDFDSDIVKYDKAHLQFLSKIKD